MAGIATSRKGVRVDLGEQAAGPQLSGWQHSSVSLDRVVLDRPGCATFLVHARRRP
jgi:hypothetical protein